eukprot:9111081-Alexandrium_andersonii.AAC.1
MCCPCALALARLPCAFALPGPPESVRECFAGGLSPERVPGWDVLFACCERTDKEAQKDTCTVACRCRGTITH